MLATLTFPAWVSGAEITTVASGTYDENIVQANAVDINQAAASAFQTALNTAYPAGRGGVLTFDGLPTTTQGSQFVVAFASGTKTLRISDGVTHDGFLIGDGTSSSRTPISGNRMLQGCDELHEDGYRNDWVFNFHEVEGGAPNERVVRAAFTILGRNGTGRVIEMVRAIFDDQSEASIANVNYSGQGTSDTFIEFQAPAGRFLQSIRIENTGFDFTSLDDIGFITADFPVVLTPLTPYTGAYLNAAKSYADTMMAHGRDTYGSGVLAGGGPKQSGLFLSALDRVGPNGAALISDLIPAAATGVREHDRVIHLHRDNPNRRLYGSDLGDNQPFLQMLNELSNCTGDPQYANAVQENLDFMFRHARSGINNDVTVPTGLLAWGEHLNWDVINDKAATGYYTGKFIHEFTSRFDLWKQVYATAPQSAEAYATGLWNWQINNKTTGDYDRHAYYEGANGLSDEFDFPRHGSYYIQTWAAAIQDKTDTSTDAFFRNAVSVVTARFENKKAAALAAYGPERAFIQLSDNVRDADKWNTMQTLDLTLSAHIAAEMIDPSGADPLSQRLIALARAEDATFLAQTHFPASSGFIVSRTLSTGRVTGRSGDWGLAYGSEGLGHIIATQVAERAAQLDGSQDPLDITHRAQYRALVLAAADFYLTSDPDLDKDGSLNDENIWAVEFASVINVMIEAYAISADAKYLERARYFADNAVNAFWGAHNLPRGSTDTNHYEALTGTGDLGLALLKLHGVLMRTFLPQVNASLAFNENGHAVVTTAAIPGAKYALQYSHNLKDWSTVDAGVASSDTISLVHQEPGLTRAFYRLFPIVNSP